MCLSISKGNFLFYKDQKIVQIKGMLNDKKVIISSFPSSTPFQNSIYHNIHFLDNSESTLINVDFVSYVIDDDIITLNMIKDNRSYKITTTANKFYSSSKKI